MPEDAGPVPTSAHRFATTPTIGPTLFCVFKSLREMLGCAQHDRMAFSVALLVTRPG